MNPYFPDPNPPSEAKPCQTCGTLVGGDETEGWWLERKVWQEPNYYQLLCLPCCVDAMAEESIHPDVADEAEAREALYGDRQYDPEPMN